MDKQQHLPLIDAITKHIQKNPISFHVPGHKNGEVFPEQMREFFDSILKMDLTELTGLDDLHQAQEGIKEAQQLTAELYRADYSYFLVGGSTAGNLAMILAASEENKPIIVQRNSHKSIMNAIELSGARPVFVSPEYEEITGRYSLVTKEQILKAIEENRDATAIVLTYPDYFGRTYDLEAIIRVAHSYNIPVLIDEAHGAHFILGEPFPRSAVTLGADIVVQSAHKMLPAMTMASFLHMKSELIEVEKVKHYLEILQSSSPSYPLMASLDIARNFLATTNKEQIKQIVQAANEIKSVFQEFLYWNVLPHEKGKDDPLKITVEVNSLKLRDAIISFLEEKGIFPELSTGKQILFILGLGAYVDKEKLQNILYLLQEKLKTMSFDDKIEVSPITYHAVSESLISIKEMNKRGKRWSSWEDAEGEISFETVTPYPPGIPLLLKGEKIKSSHIEMIQQLINSGQKFHYNGTNIEDGIYVMK